MSNKLLIALMRMLYLNIQFFLLWCPTLLLGQMEEPLIDTNWTRYLGGYQHDVIKDLVQSSTEVIALTGSSQTQEMGEQILFRLVKPNGEILPKRDFGGPGMEAGNALLETFDGGFLIAGYTDSGGFGAPYEVDSKFNRKRPFLLKLDENGNYLWDRALKDAPKNGQFNDILQLPNGDFLAGGSVNDKAYLSRLNSKGDLVWDKFLPQNLKSVLKFCLDDQDNIGILADAKETEHNARQDLFLLVNSEGKMLQSPSRLAGGGQFKASSLLFDAQYSRFVICGTSQRRPAAKAQLMIMYLNKDGEYKQHFLYKSQGEEQATAIIKTTKGEYAVAASSYSHSRGARRPKGGIHFIKAVDWKKSPTKTKFIGGIHTEFPSALAQLNDGSLLLAGSSNSNTGVYHDQDAWVAKLKDNSPASSSMSNRLLLTVNKLVTPNSSDTLYSGERAYVQLRLENPGQVSIQGVKVQVSAKKSEGLIYSPSLHLGYINPLERKTFAIPITGSQELRSGKNQLEIVLTNSAKDTINAFTIDFYARALDRPVLKFANALFQYENNKPIRNQSITLNLTLRNIGTMTAEKVRIGFFVPRRVKTLNKQALSIEKLQAGDSIQLSFSFEANRFYKPDSISINCYGSLGNDFDQINKTFTVKFNDARKMSTSPVMDTISSGSSAQSEPIINMFWNHPKDDGDGKVYRLIGDEIIPLKLKVTANLILDDTNFQIVLNGNEVKPIRSPHLHPKSLGNGNYQYQYETDLTLSPGYNKISLQIINDGKVLGRVLPDINVIYTEAERILHLVSIGVPKNLNYSCKDAKAFTEAMKSQKGNLFKDVRSYLFNTSEETDANSLRYRITKILDEYRHLHSESNSDTSRVVHEFMMFISSHGYLHNPKGTLMIRGSDHNPYQTLYPDLAFEEDILPYLQDLPGRKYLFLDCCRSGDIIGSQKDNDDPSEKYPIIPDSLFEGDNFIFLSCQPGEFSYEHADWGHGAFTKGILQAFENKEVKVNGRKVRVDGILNNSSPDGYISVNELSLFLYLQVPEIVRSTKGGKKRKQTPYSPDKQQKLGFYRHIYKLPEQN